jgi:hypothetical protein
MHILFKFQHISISQIGLCKNVYVNLSSSARHEGIWKCGGIALLVLDLDTSGHNWPSSRTDCFTPGETAPVPFNRRLGVSTCWIRRFGEILTPQIMIPRSSSRKALSEVD